MISSRSRWALLGLLAMGVLLSVAGYAIYRSRPWIARNDVVVIGLGTLNPGKGERVVGLIAKAERAGAAAVVLELDSPGGVVADAIDISDAMRGSSTPVFAWIKADCHGAAIFPAFAAHSWIVAPGVRVHAPAPAIIGGPMPKIESFLLGELQTSAKQFGHPMEVVEALWTDEPLWMLNDPTTGVNRFVDAKRHAVLAPFEQARLVPIIEGPTPCKLTAAGALACGLATVEASDLSQLAEHMGWQGHHIVRTRP